MTQLSPTRLREAEHSVMYWHVTPEHGTPFEALLDPAYWAHVSSRLKPNDHILVDAEDGSYWGEIKVRDAGKLYAKVSKLHYVELDHVEVEQSGHEIKGFEVKYRGPVQKWSVIRLMDKAVLKDGMLKNEANLWLTNYVQAQAA